MRTPPLGIPDPHNMKMGTQVPIFIRFWGSRIPKILWIWGPYHKNRALSNNTTFWLPLSKTIILLRCAMHTIENELWSWNYLRIATCPKEINTWVLFPQEGIIDAGLVEPLVALITGDHIAILELPVSAKYLQFLHPSGSVLDDPLFAWEMPHLPI